MRRTKCYVYLNLFFLLTRSSHWNVLLNRLVIKYLICYLTEVHLLVKLQSGGTNKQLKWNLSGISQGFDKCTKATKTTPLDDCFGFETWSQYHYNKKRQKFKIILIQRSSRKMNGNKNLLILYYVWKTSTFSTLFHSKL